MNVERKGYAEEIYTELGIKADSKLTQDIVGDISKGWNILQAQLKHPVAILIGGFQGSGKTTVAKTLSLNLQLPVISSDEIRHRLLQRNIAPSDGEFNSQVVAVRNSLVSMLGQEKASFILDQIITPARTHLVESILRKNCETPYDIVGILLVAPLETLRERVSARLPLPGTYQGTLEELEDTVLNKGSFELSIFKKVFDTEELRSDGIVSEIQQMIRDLQK